MTWVRILFDDAEPMNIAAETASKKVTTGLPGGTYGLSKLILSVTPPIDGDRRRADHER